VAAKADRSGDCGVAKWSLTSGVAALQASRGVNLVAAATVMAEISDLRRF